MTGGARRWDVSAEELERINAARRRSSGARATLLLLLRRPDLLVELARTVGGSVRTALVSDNSLTSLLDAENLSAFPNVRVATTDGFTLSEFADGAFDVASGQGVLGYVEPNQLLGLLDEVRRVLAADGVCVFNYATIDDPHDARATICSRFADMTRRRRVNGGVDQPRSTVGSSGARTCARC